MHPRALGHYVAIVALLVVASAASAQRSRTQKSAEQAPATATRASDTATLVLPHGLEARSIGPAVMGGRVSSKDVLASYENNLGAKHVHPGTYTVTVSYGKAKSSTELETRAVPRLETL